MSALDGRTVLVTRPRHQAQDLAEPLEGLGAKVFLLPTIGIAPPEDSAPFDEALRGLAAYDWVVLTSVNGVEAVRARMAELGLSPETLSSRKLAVIGPSTGRALSEAFRAPDLMPSEYVAEAIAEALGDVAGQRFLLARADLARRELAETLRARGAVVDEVPAYRIVRETSDADLPEEVPDFITLTSSEAARATREALMAKGRGEWMSQSTLACIGPITAATVAELGYATPIVAREYTIPGLIDAMLEYTLRPEATHA